MRVFLVSLAIFTTGAFAQDTNKITPGDRYKNYSNEELRRRVYQLERAVSQLQDQVFQLALRSGEGSGSERALPWTCHMEIFGKSFNATAPTKAAALARTVAKCSEANDSIHCMESRASCDNK